MIGRKGRPDPYPTVPLWAPINEPRTSGRHVVKLERGTPQLLRRLDDEWGHIEDLDPVSVGWVFAERGRKRVERWVVIDEIEGRPLAVWLDHNELVYGDAYRLDFLKVRPDMVGEGLGPITVDYVRERARALGAVRFVFQSTPTSHAWWTGKMGAIECGDWRGHDSALKNLQCST